MIEWKFLRHALTRDTPLPDRLTGPVEAALAYAERLPPGESGVVIAASVQPPAAFDPPDGLELIDVKRMPGTSHWHVANDKLGVGGRFLSARNCAEYHIQRVICRARCFRIYDRRARLVQLLVVPGSNHSFYSKPP